jgi:hypothetical protein
MAFNSNIIKQVKEKAAFRCCRCQAIGIEVHHIIPQKDSGPDTFENAAPLCPNCHTWFGDNPRKQKEITEMRDWWYKIIENQYPNSENNFQILNEINTKVEALANNQDQALIDLKETLKKAAFDTIDKMTAGTAQITASGIANTSIAPYLTGKTGISEVYDSNYLTVATRVKCPKCGTLGKLPSTHLMTITSKRHYKCETCRTEFQA